MTDDEQTTEIQKTPRDLTGVLVATPFIPVAAWPELEEARVRHERAIAEVRDARREEGLMKGRHRAQQAQEVKAAAGRVLDGEPPVDPAAAEDSRRREVHAVSVRIQAAHVAQRDAVMAALQIVEEHPEWAEEMADRRAAAEAEREDLLAKADVARVLAHREGHMEAWLRQAAAKVSPQPFREAGPPPPPAQTVSDVFGHARAS